MITLPDLLWSGSALWSLWRSRASVFLFRLCPFLCAQPRTTLIRGAATRRKVPTSGGGIEVNPKSKDKNRQKVSQKILLALPFLFNSKDNGSADSHTPGKSAQRHLLIESEWMLGWFSRGRAYLLERCVRRTRTDRRSQNRADLLDGVRKE